ncbi:MAG: hypothetical protein ACT4PW_03515 [Acidimicrobiia bacterium]
MSGALTKAARNVAAAIGLGRILIGGSMVVAPALLGRGWIGLSARQGGGQVALRALGIRDAAIGAGTILAVRSGMPVRWWLRAGGVCDAVDAAATMLAGDEAGPDRHIVVGLAASTALFCHAVAAVADR